MSVKRVIPLFLLFFLRRGRKGVSCCKRCEDLCILIHQIQKIRLTCLKLSKQFLHQFLDICIFFLSHC